MTLEIVALALTAYISIILPLIVLGIIIKKNREYWRGIIVVFLCGMLIYTVTQWGIKEHGLSWLFNHTNLSDLLNNHYILYLLIVALIGALLTTMVQAVVVILPFERNLSFAKAIAFGLGYGMLESALLIGIKSINTIVEMMKESEAELNTNSTELFLSGYERILIMIIEIGIVVVLIYFIEQNMFGRGAVIAVVCYTLVSFLPSFFIAFSLKDYYEVYDRSIALILIYIILTVAAFTSLVVMNAYKYRLKD